MTAILFVGPSLAPADGASAADFNLRPPARQGDVYRAAGSRPDAIGVIDGYFEGVPSVWHKEILWAIAHGIPVYGSASIGALRAAELDACGMIGVGDIYAAYRDGLLDADDEVALLHGPEEAGFIALTEPLVNVRATCRAALAEGILDDSETSATIDAARSLFYKQRTWREIAQNAVRAGIALNWVEGFMVWLPGGRVDQKRRDALQMIERMRADLSKPSATRGATDRAFAPTFLWERAVAGWARSRGGVDPVGDIEEALLNELRLDPERYRRIKTRALARMYLLGQAAVDQSPVTQSERAAASKEHRMAHGLFRAADLDRWLTDQNLDRPRYDRLIEETALAELAAANEDAELHQTMVALLKLDGTFGALATRAAAKAALTEEKKSPPQLPPVLLEWFFRTRLKQDVPEDIDRFIRSLGLSSRESFYGLLAEEYIYLVAEESGRPPH